MSLIGSLRQAAQEYEDTKLRWRIAMVVDKLPGQCWADLVDWVQHNEQDESKLPWFPQRRCQQDVERCGTCYCGKIRNAESFDG